MFRSFLILIPVGFLWIAIICMNRLKHLHLNCDFDYKRDVSRMVVQNRLRSSFSLLVVGSCMIPFVLWFFMGFSGIIFLPLLLVPMALGMVQEVWQVDGLIYNDVFKRSKTFFIVYNLLFTAGVLTG